MSEVRHQGVVFQFDRDRGFGFVVDPDGGERDVFVHVKELDDESTKAALRNGSKVEFEILDGDRGPMAIHIELMEDGSGPAASEDYHSDLTEALISRVPSITTGQLAEVRKVALDLALDRGWVS